MFLIFSSIYDHTNSGAAEQLVKYRITLGVSQTTGTSETLTETTSNEIGFAFKAFSAGHSSSIEQSWTVSNQDREVHNKLTGWVFAHLVNYFAHPINPVHCPKCSPSK